MKIVVTGIGIVSALGIGVDENISKLRKNSSGISLCPEILKTGNKIPVGEIKLTNDELKLKLGLDGFKTVSRTALLGMLAAKEALEDAGLDDRKKVGIVSSTSVGGMDLTEIFFREFIRDESKGRLRNVRMHDCGASTEAIAEYCGIEGYRTTISTACSSAANAIIHGVRLLKHRVLDAVLVGGTDSLSAFTLNGFKSLMILDDALCRPFDNSRAGLNLGEGAGYLLLQREEDCSGDYYCSISGYSNRNDAFHQTASSENGEGAYLSMKEAVDISGLSLDSINYINVHGTGTCNNDMSEGIAMKRLFGDIVPMFSSTKVYTGHTLAAAGGIEAVFSVLSVSKGYVYSTFNFKSPIEGLDISPCTEFTINSNIKNVLSNSFGFGGNCSSILFSR